MVESYPTIFRGKADCILFNSGFNLLIMMDSKILRCVGTLSWPMILKSPSATVWQHFRACSRMAE